MGMKKKKKKKWQERAGRCEETGECKAWRKNAGEKGCLTNGERDTKLDKERERREAEGSTHWDKRKEGRQKIR